MSILLHDDLWKPWTTEEASLKGYSVHYSSQLIQEFRDHGFKSYWISSDSSSPWFILPRWVSRLDSLFHRFCRENEISRSVFCGVCATLFIYNNEELNEKWAGICCLLAPGGPSLDAYLGNLCKDLKLAGHRDFGCSVEVEEHNGL